MIWTPDKRIVTPPRRQGGFLLNPFRFGGGDSPPDNIWSTDFGEYAVGEPPSDWTNEWDPAGWSVLEDTPSESGKVLRTSSIQGRQGLSWNAPGDLTDVELYAVIEVVSVSNAPTRARLLVRGTGSGSGTEEGYFFGIESGGTSVRLFKWVNGTGSTLAQESFTVSAGNRYKMRFRCQGTSLAASIWSYGDTEPESWTISTTDASISDPGWVGVGEGYTNLVRYQYFSVQSLD